LLMWRVWKSLANVIMAVREFKTDKNDMHPSLK